MSQSIQWGWEGRARGLRTWEETIEGDLPWGSRKSCLGPEAGASLGSHCSLISDPRPAPLPSPLSI